MSTPKGWTKHPAGQTQVFPVTGWKTAIVMGGKAAALRIEFGTEPTMQKRDSRQLLLHASQVRSLADMLTRLADELDERGDGAPEDTLN